MLRNYNSRDGPKLEEESHLATCAKLEENFQRRFPLVL